PGAAVRDHTGVARVSVAAVEACPEGDRRPQDSSISSALTERRYSPREKKGAYATNSLRKDSDPGIGSPDYPPARDRLSTARRNGRGARRSTRQSSARQFLLK